MKIFLLCVMLLAPGMVWAQQGHIRVFFKASELACGETQKDYATNDTELDRSFEVVAYEWSAEQTLAIGSVTTGTGAGRIGFEALKLTRFSDTCSPLIFEKQAQGTPFTKLRLVLFDDKKNARMTVELRLVAIRTLYVTGNTTDPSEAINLEFGAVRLTVVPTDALGNLDPKNAKTGTWSRVKNNNTLDVN